MTCSNNKAKYQALIIGLELLLEWNTQNVEIYGDYQLVIKEITREYKCGSVNMAKYLHCDKMTRWVWWLTVTNMLKLKNEKANTLTQIASRYKIGKFKFLHWDCPLLRTFRPNQNERDLVCKFRWIYQQIEWLDNTLDWIF